MRPTRIAAALLALGVFSVWGSGYAADKVDFGKREFDSNCAICHGLKGKGDGPYTDIGALNTRVADLTTLAKKNGGVFPVQHIYEVIDGRQIFPAHGTREMPIWGSRYHAEARGAYFFDSPYDEETYIRTRIIWLVDYLNRLQVK
jgi:mono/diheme cytochrome c family protein